MLGLTDNHFRNFRGRCGMGLQYLSSKRNLVPCWVEHHAEGKQSHLQRTGPLPTLWKMCDGMRPGAVPAVIWQLQRTESPVACGARPLYGDGCSFHPASDSQPQTIPQIKKSLRQTKCSDFFIYDFKKSLMSCAVCSALVRIEGCPPFSKRWIFVCGSIR